MLKSRLPKIAAEMKPRLEAALKSGAHLVEASAKSRVPVDQGDLQRAIHVEHQDGGQAVVAGDDKVFYGHIVEHGGGHSPPQPFLVPALQENAHEVVQMARAALRRL